MNFIHRALAQGRRLSDDDFLQAMADIYRESQVWQELDRYPPYIRDVIYVIDYDTEVQMEGLDACAASPRAEQYIQALRNCGAVSEAEILKRAKKLTDGVPAIQIMRMRRLTPRWRNCTVRLPSTRIMRNFGTWCGGISGGNGNDRADRPPCLPAAGDKI